MQVGQAVVRRARDQSADPQPPGAELVGRRSLSAAAAGIVRMWKRYMALSPKAWPSTIVRPPRTTKVAGREPA